jgi:hypothetical protein
MGGLGRFASIPPQPLLHQWIRKLQQILQKQYGL